MFSSLSSSQQHTPPYPPNFIMFSLSKQSQKHNKEKKSNQTNKKQIRQEKCQNKTKSSQKKTHHGDHFVLATISVSAAFLPSRMLIYPVTLHDRKLFSFANDFQLQIACWLGWDPMSIFPSQSCDSVCVGLVHLPASASSSVLLCLGDTISLESSIIFDSFNLSTPSLYIP